MPAIAGYTGRVYISGDGGSTYNELLQLRNVELTISQDTYDSTTHANQGWKSNVGGLKEWSATAEECYVPGDADQSAAFAGITANTLLKFRFDPSGTAGGKERYTGDGYITSWKQSSPNSDLAAVNIEIKGSGALAKSSQ